MIDFIDRVGEAVTTEVTAMASATQRLVIFAGYDNCGAYALTAATFLNHLGYKPVIYLFNIGGNRLNRECEMALRRFREMCPEGNIVEVTGLRFAMPELDSDCVIVDGLFGGDHTEPLTGGYQHMVRNINESGAVIISIDTPSGLASDAMSGLINRNIIHADLTLAVGLPHLSFFTAENAELVGRWKVIDIGLSREAVARAKTSHYLIERRDINRLLPVRMFNSSKADYGDAIIFAGSYGMMESRRACHKSRGTLGLRQSDVPLAPMRIFHHAELGAERALRERQRRHRHREHRAEAQPFGRGHRPRHRHSRPHHPRPRKLSQSGRGQQPPCNPRRRRPQLHRPAADNTQLSAAALGADTPCR